MSVAHISDNNHRLDKPRILIVDDDKLFTRILEFQLRSHGFRTIICNSSQNLYDFFETREIPQAFIIDLNLGHNEPSGLEICRKIKSYCNSPVLILTAYKQIEALVSCFSAGAIHFIVKPCDIRELAARLRSALNDPNKSPPTITGILNVKVDDNLYLCPAKQTLVRSDGAFVRLTQHELGVMEIILNTPERYIERHVAFYALYEYEMDPTSRRIDLLVSRLRKKLFEVSPDYIIRNIRGHGYLLCKR